MSAIAPLTVVYTPLALIVPLIDAEDGIGQGVVAQELPRATLHYHTHNMT